MEHFNINGTEQEAFDLHKKLVKKFHPDINKKIGGADVMKEINAEFEKVKIYFEMEREKTPPDGEEFFAFGDNIPDDSIPFDENVGSEFIPPVSNIQVFQEMAVKAVEKMNEVKQVYQTAKPLIDDFGKMWQFAKENRRKRKLE